MGVTCKRSITVELCSQQVDGDFFVVEELHSFLREGCCIAGQDISDIQGWFILEVCFKQEHVVDSKNTFCAICFQERKNLVFPE